MNAKDKAELELAIAAIQAGVVEAVKPLAEQVAALIAANTALEQRSSNFAARVSSHNACYRAEIKALREEVLALKEGKKFAPAAERISTEAWKAAHADLCRLNPGKSYFPSDRVKAHAKAMAQVKPLTGYTEGDPLTEDTPEDEYSF
jgi:hypothetical protein